MKADPLKSPIVRIGLILFLIITIIGVLTFDWSSIHFSDLYKGFSFKDESAISIKSIIENISFFYAFWIVPAMIPILAIYALITLSKKNRK